MRGISKKFIHPISSFFVDVPATHIYYEKLLLPFEIALWMVYSFFDDEEKEEEVKEEKNTCIIKVGRVKEKQGYNYIIIIIFKK